MTICDWGLFCGTRSIRENDRRSNRQCMQDGMYRMVSNTLVVNSWRSCSLFDVHSPLLFGTCQCCALCVVRCAVGSTHCAYVVCPVGILMTASSSCCAPPPRCVLFLVGSAKNGTTKPGNVSQYPILRFASVRFGSVCAVTLDQ